MNLIENTCCDALAILRVNTADLELTSRSLQLAVATLQKALPHADADLALVDELLVDLRGHVATFAAEVSNALSGYRPERESDFDYVRLLRQLAVCNRQLFDQLENISKMLLAVATEEPQRPRLRVVASGQN